MDFFNGTYTISGTKDFPSFETGIGLAPLPNTEVTMDRITLHGGTYNFNVVTGVGIGIGDSMEGGERASLRELTLKSPTVTIVTQQCGIGIRGAWQRSSHSLSSIRIEGGTYDIRAYQFGTLDESVAGGIGIGRLYGGNASIGSIVIEDGDFTIRSVSAAGIGHGSVGLPSGTGHLMEAEIGAIQISKGIFDIHTRNAAGIGGGFSYQVFPNRIGEIAIGGGTFVITATIGSAIGGGVGKSQIDRIAISAGTFTIAATDGASGIGSGTSHAGGPATVSELRIRGGHFDISAADSVAIGAGFGDNADSTVEQLIIENGTFVIKLNASTGIGSAICQHGNSVLHNLTILDGDFQIETNGAPGIGSGTAGVAGNDAFGISIVRNITIAGGHIVISTTLVAALGAGYGPVGNSTVGTLHIRGGVIAATSVGGCAIGGGRSLKGTAIAYYVEISGGEVHAISVGSVAIGGGFCQTPTIGRSRLETLALVGGIVTAEGSLAIGQTASANLTQVIIGGSAQLTLETNSSEFDYGILPTLAVASVAGSLTYISHNPRLFAAALAPDLSALTVTGYYTGPAEVEAGAAGSFLQIGAFALGNRTTHILAFAIGTAVAREVEIALAAYAGLVVSLPPGVYGITSREAPGGSPFGLWDSASSGFAFAVPEAGTAYFGSVAGVAATAAQSPDPTPLATISRSDFPPGIASPTPMPSPSRSPSISPRRFSAVGDAPIPAAYTNQSLLLDGEGSGTIRANEGGVLELTVVTIPPNREITAVNLTVYEGLTLAGASVLKPRLDELIVIKDDVFFELAEEEKALPTVDLGEIGANFTIVPSVVAVAIKATDYSQSELNSLDAVLVEGRTLGNCEKWIDRVDLGSERDRFEAYCKYWGTEEAGRKVRAANERVSLNLKKRAGSDQEKPKAASLAWVAAPVVVVVVVIVAVVFVVVRAKKRAVPNSSDGDAAA
jgi:hypothetical protein